MFESMKSLWKREPDGKRQSVTALNLLCLVLSVMAIASLMTTGLITTGVFAETITWVNPASGTWNNTGNWDPADIPNEAGEDVLIPNDGNSYTITVDMSPSVDYIMMSNPNAILEFSGRSFSFYDALGLVNDGTVEAISSASYLQGNFNNNSGGVFNIYAGATHYWQYGAITNNGTIYINSNNGTANSTLYSNAPSGQTLLGTGEVVMLTNGSTDDAIFRSYSGTLVHGSDHTIRGSGSVRLSMINEGEIIADVNGSALLLSTQIKTNTNLFKATNNGILQISTGNITQGESGVILADGGTVQLLGSATISGGSFDSDNGGKIETTASYSYLADITNLGDYGIHSGAGIYMRGTEWTNDGVITINTSGGANNAILYVNTGSNIDLLGAGEILMQTAGTVDDAQLRHYSGSLTQGPDHTIHGAGKITTPLYNNGIVSADTDGAHLVFDVNNMTNNNIFQATNNGILQIQNCDVTQGPEGIIRADGGEVELTPGARITGGALETSNGGTIETVQAYSYLTDIINRGNYGLHSGAGTYMQGTEWTNDGVITINTNAGTSNAVFYVNTVSSIDLLGAGEILMQTAGTTDDAQLRHYTGSLTQGPDHTIHGAGKITVSLYNNGLVSADTDGAYLVFDVNNMTNNNIYQATNNGILQIQNCAVTQGSEGVIRADGGKVELASGARITGGAFETSNGGTIETVQAYSYLTDIVNRGDYGLHSGGQTYMQGTEWINDGVITINTNAGTSNAIFYVNTVSSIDLLGAGEILMQTAGTIDDAQLRNYSGSLTQGPDHTIRGEGRINVTLTNEGLVSADVDGRTLLQEGFTKTNEGIFRATNNAIMDITAPLYNNGLCESMNGGTMRITNYPGYSQGTFTGGTWHVHENSTTRFVNMPVTTLNADILLNGLNSNLYSDGETTDALAGWNTIGREGRFEIRNSRDFTTAGELTNAGAVIVCEACSLTVNGPYVQNSPRWFGKTTVNGTLVCADSVDIQGGLLEGNGVIVSDVYNSSHLNPGSSAGLLTIDGDFEQTETGKTHFELGGTGEGEYDHLAVTGVARLGGYLRVVAIDGFEVNDGDTFLVMTFASRTGDFEEIIGCPGPGECVELVYTDTTLTLVVHELPASDVDDPVIDDPFVDPIVDDNPAEDLPNMIRFAGRMSITGEAILELDLPRAADVQIGIFDISGRRVATINQNMEPAGSHSYNWTGRADNGRQLASGIFFARAKITTDSETQVRKTRVHLLR